MIVQSRAYRPADPPKVEAVVVGILWRILLLLMMVGPAAVWAQGDCPESVDVLQPISCSGADDGVLSVSVPDGVLPSEVYWLQNNDTLFGATQANLGPGSYLVFIPGCAPLGETLTEPFNFFISAAVSRLPTCDDPCSGEITVTPNFGQGDITYSWSHDAAETTAVGQNVCEQVVLVSAIDENGCSDQDIITVEIPDIEVLTFSTDPSCFGFADGTAAAVATGGLGGEFAFEWQDAAGNVVGNTADITGLVQGTYVVTATDTGGCVQTATELLNAPAPISVEVNATGVGCFGDEDGTAEAILDGAVLYEWTGPDGFSVSGPDASALADLAPGTYSVLVTAADGCVGEGAVEVDEPDPVQADPYLEPPSCPGLEDGVVGAVASGGTPDYNTTWTLPGGGTASGTFLTGVSAGTYAFSVEDANGCMTTGTAVLDDPNAVAFSIATSDPSCAEGPLSNDGEAVATVTGGLAPYTGAWIDLATGDLVALGLSATGIGPGTYGFGVMDLLGCSLDTVVVIGAPDSLLLTTNGTPPTCAGALNGTASAEVSGGTGGYSVLWSGDIDPVFADEITGLGVGTYAVEVTDGNGCVATDEVVLAGPPPLILELETVPVGCEGNDGAAYGTIVGGTAPYSWSWTDNESAQVSAVDSALSLTTGNYTAAVTDGSGCVIASSVTIVALPPLELSLSVGALDCVTGSAAVSALTTGGASPVDLSLTADGNSTSFVSGAALPPGSYTLTATDDRGCSTDTAWVLNPALEVNVSTVPFGCDGGGVIEVEATGGDPAGSLTFGSTSLGAPDEVSGNTATWSSVGEGSYTISVSDGTCEVLEPVLMEGVSLFDWNVEVLPYACEGAAGVISVDVMGGLDPLVVSGAAVSGDTTWSTLEATGLSGGTYTLSVTDNAGCQRDTVIDVLALQPLVIDPTVVDVQCAGANEGSIAVATTGGASPLSFGAVGPDGPVPQPWDNLAAGSYYVGVVDARGCLTDTTVEVGAPAPFEVITSVQPESCVGVADGAVQVEVQGGTAPVEVTWDGGPASGTWSNLEAGVFAWTAVDFNGCDTTGTLEVLTGGGLIAVAEVLPTTCEDGVAFGAVSVTVNGGASDAVVLLGGLPADSQDINDTAGVWTWFNLAPGSYGWTAEVGPSCGSDGQVVIDLPSPLLFQGATTPADCGGGLGSIAFEPLGGTAPLNLTWQGVSLAGDTLSGTGSAAADVPEGQYTATLADAAGCARDTVLDVAALSLGLTMEQELVQPTCGGALAGEATLIPAGGLPPYEVVVQGAADTTFLPFLVPGAYPVTLTDSVGCTFLDSIVISPASDFELFADVDSASCAGTEDGQIILTTANGVGEVDYTFSGPFGAVAVADTIPDLGAGIYEITALDAEGCPAVLLVEVAGPPPVLVTLDSLGRPSCTDDTDGLLAVSVEGGQGGPFEVNWTLDGEFWGSGAIQDGLGEGLYAVEALDASGCAGGIDAIPLVAEGDVTLSVPADTVLCAGNALQLEASATGATEAFWSVPDGQDGLGLTAFSASVAEGGTYWTFTAVRLGCVQSDSVQVTGLALPTPNAGQDVLIVSGAVAAIGTAGSTEDWTYAWSPAGDVAFPELAATPTEALFETTTFVLEATTSEGCSAYDTVVVDVLQTLDIPSGFSPNGDGTNDFWNLNGLEQYPSAEITVFNRWGDVLFTQGATDGPWDGNLNGIAVPIGTYYYHIRVDEPALQTEWTGPITILR